MNGWPGVRTVIFASALLAFTSVAAGEQVLVEIGSSTNFLANSTNPNIGNWTLPEFDDSSWANGPFGVGYDDNGASQNLIQTNVPNTSLSVYTRTTFTVFDVASLTNLFLGFEYDDGYVAWINGIEVDRSDSMPVGPPTWDSAPTDHESSNGLVPAYEFQDISVLGLDALEEGTNVLAIGVWNATPASTDLVLVPNLTADKELTVTRGPYLQQGTPDSIVVRWRTSYPTDSVVQTGPAPDSLTPSATDPTLTTEHIVPVAGLIRESCADDAARVVWAERLMACDEAVARSIACGLVASGWRLA